MTPKDKATNVSLSPKLEVKVSDPTNDQLDVSFNRGYQYKADQKEHVSIFTNSVDHEPPETLTSTGEKRVTAVNKLTKVDGQYITTKGMEKYPYHRFELNLDKEADSTDDIEINWEGKSIIGRKVSMYVWNYDTKRWEVKEWKIAENSKNFQLHASVKGREYIKNHKVQVMVQDEIAATNQFDYSLIWMSDTQYYSESYPHIYNKMTEWIAAQKAAMNIKYVFHTGDLVDDFDQEYEWQNADNSMKTLDQANVPYGVLAGNHDVNHKAEDYTKYGEYFGESRFAGRNYYGASYKNNRGHYDLISEKGNDFVMLYMGWGVNEEDMAWMNEVLAKYPERKPSSISMSIYLYLVGVVRSVKKYTTKS
jgi:Calcineurin-like phosphoesterase.